MISREEGHINKDIVQPKEPKETKVKGWPSMKGPCPKCKTYINHIVVPF